MSYDPMRDYAVIGGCVICSQGMLYIARATASQELFVSCEECLSEWESPTTVSIGKSTWGKHESAELVEYEDLKDHPWLEAVDNYRRPTIR
jgi:hypothetical protein